MAHRPRKMLIVRPDVTLQALRTDDAHVLFALVEKERERLRRTLPWLDATTSKEDMRQFLLESEDAEHNGSAYRFAITIGNVMAGIASLEACLTPDVRIGYWIGHAYEGQGRVTDSVKALAGFGFKELRLASVGITAWTDNQKSQAVARRAGFTETKRLPAAECLYGVYVDHILFEMKREDAPLLG